jgi:hypothetical protein
MPPLAPPYGSPDSAHFQLIQIARAATSPRSTWNSMLTFGVDAGPFPNKAGLQSFCDIITERLKRLYDVGA